MASDAYDAIVIGSGFGGAVAALRLAQARRSVLVLERGRRYKPGEFPRSVFSPASLLWGYPEQHERRGLYRMDFFPTVGVVSASGWGGGSLVYANIHIRAPEWVFRDPRWRGITRGNLDPYYDRVAKMLAISPLDPSIAVTKRSIFHAVGKRIGRPVFDPDQAVAWSDPNVAGRKACQLCSECEMGCQFGAKNTLDFNYLAQAEALGIEVELGANVTIIEAERDAYRVHYSELDSGTVATARARRVVMAAGTLGTQRILFASRDQYLTLPKLSPTLGLGISANGDFIGTMYGGMTTTPLEPLHGPDVTSVMRFDDEAPQFTVAAPAFNINSLAMLNRPGVARAPAFLGTTPYDLRGSRVGDEFTNEIDPGRSTNLFAIGRDNAGGMLLWKNGDLTLDWDYARENERLLARMTIGLREIASAYGGRFEPLPTWTVGNKIVTVHPLGGCPMGRTRDEGVITPNGEVHGYPGLFVADGSAIPTSIGVHPAMTIAAMAERTAERVVKSL